MKKSFMLVLAAGVLVLLVGALVGCSKANAAQGNFSIFTSPQTISSKQVTDYSNLNRLDAQTSEGISSSTAGSQTSSTNLAPDFTGIDVVTGESISLAQYKGSTIILNFMNYGCNPSLNKIVDDQLLAIQEITSKRNDLVTISVFCGCCSPDTLRNFAKTNGFNWPWILDTDYSISAKYSAALTQYGYPTLVIIDKYQSIREVTGYLDVVTLNNRLNQILEDKPAN
jgi:peroxiredoxin